MRESGFDFHDMSHILFEVGVASLRKPVFLTFIPVGDGAVDEMLVMLWATATHFGWHPALFLMLLLALFDSKLERRQSRLLLPVLHGNTVLEPRATSTTLTCGV